MKRLNWFSPVPPTPSGIAFYTASLLPALAREVDVTLWAHESRWAPQLEQHARVRHYDPDDVPWAEVNAADATIFHLGNHAEFHAPIWQVNRKHSGIVVLHDLNLQHFFVGLFLQNRGLGEDEYRRMMAYHHPNGGIEAAESVLSGVRTADEVSQNYPLTGAALEHALGVALHTEIGCSLVRKRATVPVVYLPFFLPPDSVRPANDNAETAISATVSAYVRALLDLVDQSRQAEPRQAVGWIAGRVGKAMKPWFTREGNCVVLPNLAETISKVFNKRFD